MPRERRESDAWTKPQAVGIESPRHLAGPQQNQQAADHDEYQRGERPPDEVELRHGAVLLTWRRETDVALSRRRDKRQIDGLAGRHSRRRAVNIIASFGRGAG